MIILFSPSNLMDSRATEMYHVPKFTCQPKVHYAICCELMNVSKKVYQILPAIESSRPGSSFGIQVLCTLNNILEKIMLLVHYCSESSKLYLALTSESVALRCDRIRIQLNKCLCQIQTMVPTKLASQIAEVLDFVRDVKFIINSEEEEAGKELLNLLAQITSSEDQELEAFRNVALKLNITSSTALLVEKRALKKLLEKSLSSDGKKERILKYLRYLIKKHGTQLKPDTGEHKENVNEHNNCIHKIIKSDLDACMICHNSQLPSNNVYAQSEIFNGDMPPEEYCCPMSSSLMFDPVVIASGQTYERIFIEKWFTEGHDTCPKTQEKLENTSVVPNSFMKNLISSWCKKHGVIIPNPYAWPENVEIRSMEAIHCNSVSSLKNISTALLDGTKGDYLLESDIVLSSLTPGSCSHSSPAKGIESSGSSFVQLFSWSDDYQKHKSFSKFTQDMYLKFFYRLSELPTLLQAKAVKEMEDLLKGDDAALCSMLLNGFAEALMLFLKKVCSFSDLESQKSGARIFLAVVTNRRSELNLENEDAIQFLLSLFNCGIDEEALMIVQNVVHNMGDASCIAASYIPLEVMRFLSSKNSECLKIALNILSELSSHVEMRCHFLSSGCVDKICQLLSNESLVRFCLNIMQNIIGDEEASMLIAEANGCIASISEILEFGNPNEQEQVVFILLSLCSRSLSNCLLVMKEGIIPSLVNISVNGNAKGKENSTKLLYILRNIRHSGHPVKKNSIKL